MTPRIRKEFPLISSQHRALHADFSGGDITSDAGTLLLREADRNLGFFAALGQVIPDPRNSELITHPQAILLAQLIFGIAAGNEDFNDHHRLRDDPLWHILSETVRVGVQTMSLAAMNQMQKEV